MSTMRWFAAVALACSALAACGALFGKELDPRFCAAHPDDSECRGDGGQRCTTSGECAAPLVCDVEDTQTCVACTAAEAGACTGTTPVCGGDHACRGCAAHAECGGSGVCLPDGACADAAQVAYVAPAPAGSDNMACTQAMPCTKVASALATGRPYVKITGTNDEGGTITIDNRNVTLLAAPDGKLTRTSIGLHVEVKGSSQVEIHDLEISGALGAQGVGISMPTGNTARLGLHRVKLLNNTGGGLSVNGGTLTVSRSTISGNTGGGLSITGAQFDIMNNFITGNGGPLALVGGVELSQIPAAGTRRLEFNTISANAGNATINSGVSCGTVVSAVTFSNNVIYGNTVSGGGKQFGGSANCLAAYSDIGPDATAGTGNISTDPLFVSVLQGNFHLQAGSPAKDAADPAASLGVDIDGDPRPQGAARDMGADEIR